MISTALVDVAGRIAVRLAERRVVDAQLGQALAGLEVEVVDHEVAGVRLRTGRYGRGRGLGESGWRDGKREARESGGESGH